MPRRFLPRHRRFSRRTLVEDAARLLCAGRAEDCPAALELAGQRLGATPPWPDEAEVLAAFRERQNLFGSAEERSRLVRFRRIALECMDFLAAFAPRLSGSIALGAAGSEALIRLEVCADSAEAVLSRLLDAGIPYTVHSVPLARGAGPRREAAACEVRFLVDDAPLAVRIWPVQAWRMHRVSDGAPAWSAASLRQIMAREGS